MRSYTTQWDTIETHRETPFGLTASAHQIVKLFRSLPATFRFAVRQLLELICVPDVALRHNLGDSHAFSPALAYRRSYSDHHHPVAFHRPRLKGFIFHIVFRGIDRWPRQS